MIKLREILGATPGFKYHLTHNLPLHDNVYRYSSEKFVNLFKEARVYVNENKIALDELDKELIFETDLGEYGIYEGEKVPLDLPFFNEAEYQGRDVDLNKPKRGGSKKFYVYVRDPKTKNIKKVSFGAKEGGQRLSVKLDDPEARRNFADRHNCKDKKDKTKPGYWSCRINRYWKSLGGSKNYPGFW